MVGLAELESATSPLSVVVSKEKNPVIEGFQAITVYITVHTLFD